MQRLGLKHPLEEGHVNDGKKAGQGGGHGNEEVPVAEHAELEDALGGGPAGHGVEHVEHHEAGEGHGRITRGHDSVEHLRSEQSGPQINC